MPGYKINKWVFRTYFLFILLLGASIIYSSGAYKADLRNNFYYSCPVDGLACENPYYLQFDNPVCKKNGNFCLIEKTQPGYSYGIAPPPEWDNILYAYKLICLVTFSVALITNHIAYNEKYDFGKVSKELHFKDGEL